MKRPYKILIVSLILLALYPLGCSRFVTPTPDPNNNQEQPQDNKEPSPTANLSQYFPLTKGSTWKYQGEGNEYASFDREVLFIQENKGQIRENNGGTVSAAVFQVTDNKVTRIFFQGEAYGETNFLDEESNENVVVLQKPLEVGTSWDEPNGTREIVSIDTTVDTPAGEFKDCIKIQITAEDSTLFEYYKNGVGMVKREFISGETQVTSTLEEFEIKP